MSMIPELDCLFFIQADALDSDSASEGDLEAQQLGGGSDTDNRLGKVEKRRDQPNSSDAQADYHSSYGSDESETSERERAREERPDLQSEGSSVLEAWDKESEAEYWEDQESEDGAFWELWRNFTISRDQTQASSFDQDKLTVLKKTSNQTEVLLQFTDPWASRGLLASASGDTSIRIWDTAAGQCLSTIGAHSDAISSISWSPSSRQLASASEDQRIKIWDPTTEQCLLVLKGHSDTVSDIAWSPNGSLLASGSNDGSIKTWEPSTGRCLVTSQTALELVCSIAWAPDGKQLASGSSEGTVRIWEPAAGFQRRSILQGHTDWVRALAWSPDGNQLASGSDDGTIRIWDLSTSNLISTIEGGLDWIYALAWSPDLTQLAGASAEGEVLIWNIATVQRVSSFYGHTDWVRTLAWSPDGSQLASGSADTTVRIWQSATGQCLSTLTGHTDVVTKVVWLNESDPDSIDQYFEPLSNSEGPAEAGAVISSGPPPRRPAFNTASSTSKRAGPAIPIGAGDTRLLSLMRDSPDSPYASLNPAREVYDNRSTSGIRGTSCAHVSFTDHEMSPNNQPFAPAGDASGATMDQASLQNMALKISRLEEENRKLKGSPPRSAEERYQVLYKIHGEDSAYLSEPSWSLRGTGLPDLRGHSPIPDTEGYLNRQPEIVFVIEKHYTVEHQKKEIEKAISDRAALPDPKPAYEIIKLMPGAMVEAAEAFRKAQPSFNQDFPNWQPATLPSPFLFWYRYRESGIVDMLSGSDRSLMKLLTGWIEDNYGGIYAKVKEQFSRGVVSSSTMPFFVLPQDVLVSRQGNTTQCYTASSWAQKTVAANSFSKVLSAEDKEEVVEIWQVKVWSYGYDGGFYRNDSEVTLRLKLDEKNPEIDITTLEVFPLRFASAELQSLVDRQGRVVWKCRYKSLVSYEENREDQLYGHGERFMIDFDTYKQLHSDSTKFKRAYPQLNKRDRKEMDPKLMHSDEPPAAPHRLVLPSTMIGYNLRQKKWMDLQVDRIRDVSWNTDAFNHLVVDEDTKELIRALVSSKLDAEQGTDVIEGKGNGLIILLHGGPGTGKTFTAESVAEIAKKPLYRVTCGDIGTKPEEVEKYLESVLYLGKIWDCVVLLDEADVFLEQRTLMDLERNALVSVFLRVLEYYEGILILTSNRVGTFDDAFKSRIQLSLHYEPLTLEQRITIWRNFMKRLKKLEADASLQRARKAGSDAGGGSRYEPPAELAQAGRIDFDDIQYNIKELAAINMNGRQIRNTITTARQLAKFNGVPMKFTHLRHVIKVSSKFEDYLNELHGSTDEQLAREDRTR